MRSRDSVHHFAAVITDCFKVVVPAIQRITVSLPSPSASEPINTRGGSDFKIAMWQLFRCCPRLHEKIPKQQWEKAQTFSISAAASNSDVGPRRQNRHLAR